MANVFGMSMQVSSRGGSIDFYDDPVVLLTDISGMGLDAEVVTTERACHNGSWYRYTRVPERTITIQATYKPLSFNEVVNKRKQIHDILQPGEKLDILYNGGWTIMSLDGYAEKCEDTENGNLMVCSITIICPDPFFKGESQEELINGEATINYSGTVPTGVVLEVNDAEKVNFTINNETLFVDSNSITPASKTIISNIPPTMPVNASAANALLNTASDEPEDIILDTSKITISTLRNKKGVIYGDSDINQLSTIKNGSLYPELTPGINHITITDGSKPISGTLRYTPLYGGV